MEDTAGGREHGLWLCIDINTTMSMVSIVGHVEGNLHIPLKIDTMRYI